MNRHDEVVIVTGSSGLIGSAVINRLADHFHNIVGFDREGLPHHLLLPSAYALI